MNTNIVDAHVARSLAQRKAVQVAGVERNRADAVRRAEATPIFKPTLLDHLIPGRFGRRVRAGLVA